MSPGPERGQIWRANLNPGRGIEPGKSRPVLVVQSQALLDVAHPSTLVVPLTTRLVDDAVPLRVRVKQAGKLEQDSDLLLDQVRSIDNRRLIEGPLLRLSSETMQTVNESLREVLDLSAEDPT